MKHPYSRTLIELAVKRALKSIEDDPKRSIRYMVDLGAYFSGGRFQKRFLEKIQVMLKNEKSAYYKLVQDTVSNVAHERLLTFGMNLGYNSCTYGAKRIRELEAAEGHNIPWAISVDIGSHGLQKTFNRYASLVDEGEELGIYTWLFFMEEERQGIWSLIEEHPDSAFVLFCESYILTTDFMNRVSEFNNVMLMVEYHASASEICMQLRNRHLLYGVYYRYSAEDMNYIENGDIWREMQQLHPVFSVLIAASDCAPMIQKEIYDYVLKARESQKYATIPWEWYFDHCYIDNIISEETCFMHFDQEGDLPAGSRILFHQSLKQILEMHFRKKTQKCDKK